MAKWHGGKGSTRRKVVVGREEETLRWELLTATPERKSEILAKLAKLQTMKSK